MTAREQPRCPYPPILARNENENRASLTSRPFPSNLASRSPAQKGRVVASLKNNWSRLTSFQELSDVCILTEHGMFIRVGRDNKLGTFTLTFTANAKRETLFRI